MTAADAYNAYDAILDGRELVQWTVYQQDGFRRVDLLRKDTLSHGVRISHVSIVESFTDGKWAPIGKAINWIEEKK